MRSVLLPGLFALQCFHVAFLLLHDWVPLGPLNDTHAVRRENPGGKLLAATLLSTAPFLPPLYASAQHLHGVLPGWATLWIAIGYGLLFCGELQAWWIPYFAGTSPERVARYRTMFGATHSFLPERHGIVPNTLHVLLHVCTVATLALLSAAIHKGVAHL